MFDSAKKTVAKKFSLGDEKDELRNRGGKLNNYFFRKLPENKSADQRNQTKR